MHQTNVINNLGSRHHLKKFGCCFFCIKLSVYGLHQTVKFAWRIVLVCCSLHQQSANRNIKDWHQKCNPICSHHAAVRDGDTWRSILYLDVFVHLWNKLSVWCGRAEENPRCQPQRRVRFHFLSISKPNMNPSPISRLHGGANRRVNGGFGPRRGEASLRPDVRLWRWDALKFRPLHDSRLFFQQMAALRRLQGGGRRWSERQPVAPPTSQQVFMTFAFYLPLSAAWVLRRGTACSRWPPDGDADAASASVWASIKDGEKIWFSLQFGGIASLIPDVLESCSSLFCWRFPFVPLC